MIASTLSKSEIAELKGPITGETLFKLGDIGRAELVKGEIVFISPTGHLHGFLEINFDWALDAFVYQHKLGRVFVGEVAIYTQHNPDTVRAADVAFISREQLAQVQSQNYLDVALN